MRVMNSKVRNALLAVVLLHAVFAILFASITPYRQAGILLGQRDPATGQPARAQDIGAPDERQHANYVADVRKGQLPRFNAQSPSFYEEYQRHQPPLFYAVAAGWSAMVGADPQDPATGGRIRWLNALIGASTVVGTFFLAWWGTRREVVALGAAAFVALLPMNVALSGAISNDPLLYALCTWALALAALGIREGWTWKRALGVGLLAGLAMLTKTTGIALLPVLLLAVLLPQKARPALKMAAAAAAVSLLVVAPWWARNQSLYGDPFAIKAFNEAFTGNPTRQGFLEAFQQIGMSPSEASRTYWIEGVGGWTAKSFVGVFGYMDIYLNETGRPDTFPAAVSRRPPTKSVLYRVTLAVLALVLLAGVLALKQAESREEKSVHILNAALLIVIVLLFISFNMRYFQGQARYLFPALGPIGVALGLGLLQISRNRATPLLVAWVVGWGALSGFALSKLPSEFEKRTEPVAVLPTP